MGEENSGCTAGWDRKETGGGLELDVKTLQSQRGRYLQERIETRRRGGKGS